MTCTELILSVEKLRKEHFRNSYRLFEIDGFFDKVSNAPKEEYDTRVAEEKVLRARNEVLVEDIVNGISHMKEIKCFHRWLDIHLKTCKLIMQDIDEGSLQSTRAFVAEECYTDWLKVEYGQLGFARPNVYYLRDYDAVFDSVLAEQYHENNSPDGPSYQ